MGNSLRFYHINIIIALEEDEHLHLRSLHGLLMSLCGRKQGGSSSNGAVPGV